MYVYSQQPSCQRFWFDVLEILLKHDEVKGTGAVTNEYWNPQFVIFLILNRAGVLDDYTVQRPSR